VANTAKAVALLVDHGADCLVHLGDVGSLEVIDQLLAKREGQDGIIPAHLVFGNVDWDADELAIYARELGIIVHRPMGKLELAGKKVWFAHGDNPDRVEQAIAQHVDYFCQGHTHTPADESVGSTRIINPGALFRAARYTVALLDVASGRLEWIDVPRDLV
jgi:predicted phosphodiesterase